MKILIVLLLTIVILGNSAGGLGALIPIVIGGAIIGLGVIGALIWGIMKLFR
jgi:hypothetical protein